MKSSIYAVLGLIYISILIISPLSAVEARTVVRTGEHVSLGNQQEVEGSFYALANTVSVSGSITGDLYAVGGTITLNGEVSDDVFFVGGTVSLHASTAEDVRIIAGDVTLADSIGGSVAIYAGRVNILSTAEIAGDVLVYGGDITIDGKVGGQVLGKVGTLRVDGQVAKGIDIVTHTLTLGERADINGDVRYESPVDLIRAPGSVITGEIVPVAPSVINNSISSVKMTAIFFLILLFTALTFFLLGKNTIESFIKEVPKKVIVNGLVGLVGLIALPIVATILCITVIGSLLGVITFALVMIVAIAALPLGAIVIGSMAYKQLFRSEAINVISISIGALAISAMLLVPLVGTFIVLAVASIMVGSMLISVFTFLRSGKLR